MIVLTSVLFGTPFMVNPDHIVKVWSQGDAGCTVWCVGDTEETREHVKETFGEIQKSIGYEEPAHIVYEAIGGGDRVSVVEAIYDLIEKLEEIAKAR